MKKFKNISTIMLAFSLHSETAGAKPIDYIVHPNAEKELPSESDYVKRLVKQGYLQEVPETKAAVAKSKPAQPSVNSNSDKK